MAKLTGTNPDQVPTNADLGTMAYQDKDNVNVGGGDVTLENITLDSPTSAAAFVEFNDNGVRRWQFGNNSSNDIKINRFDSSGNYVDQPITVSGSTGIVTIPDQLSRSAGVTRLLGSSNVEGVAVQSTGEVQIAHGLTATSYNETYAALSGTTPTVNCEAGNSFSLTLSGNTTFTFSNPPASGTSYTFSIEIIQDSGASGYTVTWPASVDWPAATAPTLTATASAKDIFVFTTRDGGTNWYGFTAGQALA